MKRILIASLLFVIAVSGPVSAEMVNAGTIALERSELEAIQDKVKGAAAPAQVRAADPQPAQVNIGVTAMNAADHAALQDYVAGRKAIPTHAAQSSPVNTAASSVVDISKGDLDSMRQLTSWMKRKTPGPLFLDMPVALLK